MDFDAVEFEQVYDPNSSLKLSMGLPPIETAQGSNRPDHGRRRRQDRRAAVDPAEEKFYKAYTISYWSMPQEEAKTWLDAQFGGAAAAAGPGGLSEAGPVATAATSDAAGRGIQRPPRDAGKKRPVIRPDHPEAVRPVPAIHGSTGVG